MSPGDSGNEARSFFLVFIQVLRFVYVASIMVTLAQKSRPWMLRCKT